MKKTYQQLVEGLSPQLLNEGVGIGDLVKLKKPIEGMRYGQVNGFALDPKTVKVHDPDRPFIGAKVLSLSITLKQSPFFASDYGKKVNLTSDKFDLVVNKQQEIADYKASQGGIKPGELSYDWTVAKSPKGPTAYLKIWKDDEERAQGIVPVTISIKPVDGGFTMQGSTYKTLAAADKVLRKDYGIGIDKGTAKKLGV